jgi:hypothetical protein
LLGFVAEPAGGVLQQPELLGRVGDDGVGQGREPLVGEGWIISGKRNAGALQ